MTTTEIKSRPIIFTGESVRTILAGVKTQTRRVVKCPRTKRILWDLNRATADRGFPDSNGNYDLGYLHIPFAHVHDGWEAKGEDTLDRVYCPLGEPGDELWVKEVWCPRSGGMLALDRICKPRYRAEEELRPEWGFKWRSPMFMPKWASRLTLQIISIRPERLQDITEADAIAEGCQSYYCSPEDTASCPEGSDARRLAEIFEGGFLTAKNEFISRWQAINGKKHPWESNPWVWCIDFRKVES